jgi:hypothetical protein
MEILQVRNNVISFHGDEQLKQKYLRRVRNHRLADQIVKGIYWEGGKGCAVGCTIHSSDHWTYEEVLGIPNQFAYIQEVLFEHLPNSEAKWFPERFLRSIPVGLDLYPAFWKFVLYLLLDEREGLMGIDSERDAAPMVADLYRAAIEDREFSVDDYRDVKYKVQSDLTSATLLDALSPPASYVMLYTRKALFRWANVDLYQEAMFDPMEPEMIPEIPLFVQDRAFAWTEKLFECLIETGKTSVLPGPLQLPAQPVSARAGGVGIVSAKII